MRLIDGDKLVEDIKNYQMDVVSKATAINVIKQQPTAYDVKKVIEDISDYGIEKIYKSILPTTISAVSDVSRKCMMIVSNELLDREVDDGK